MPSSTVDHTQHVRQYVPTPDDAAVQGIVKYLGIALRRRDSATVAATDPGELAHLRESFLKRRLKLALPDADLDAAVADVLGAMAGDRDKSRVTVYYLLAQRFGKLPLFVQA